MHDMPSIMRAILDGYALPLRGDHGIGHWARVLENGHRVAKLNGGDCEIISLFSVFHDGRRINEFRDNDHGLRGGELARLSGEGAPKECRSKDGEKRGAIGVEEDGHDLTYAAPRRRRDAGSLTAPQSRRRLAFLKAAGTGLSV